MNELDQFKKNAGLTEAFANDTSVEFVAVQVGTEDRDIHNRGSLMDAEDSAAELALNMRDYFRTYPEEKGKWAIVKVTTSVGPESKPIV